MMTSGQCQAKAEEMAAAAGAAISEAAAREWETMARDWRRLAVMAGAQDGIRGRMDRELGRLYDAPL